MIRAFAAVAALLTSFAVFAQAPAAPIAAPAPAPYQVGVHYFPVEPAQPTASGPKVEIVEVFSYACGACALFQASADKLGKALPPNSTFAYMPAELQNAWVPFARAYYAADALGLREKMHQPLFNALHVDRKPIRTLEEIADFVATQGIDRAQFMAAASSFAVEAKVKRAKTTVPRYGVDSTPTLIVAGKYRIPLRRQGGSYEEMVEVARFLAAREAAAVAAAKPATP